MKLHASVTNGLMTITAYDSGYIAVNGRQLTKSFLLTPRRLIEYWPPDSFDSLTEADLLLHVHSLLREPKPEDFASRFEHHYQEIFLIDSFIGPTRPMGVLTRKDVDKPRSLGYMIATRGYFNPEDWEVRTEVVSNSRVEQGLLAGEYDSGFTTTDLARQYPDRFRVDKVIGEVDVVWLVYGKERVRTQQLLAWKDSPAARLLNA